MPKLRVEVSTTATGSETCYCHEMEQQNGMSMLETMYAAVEAGTLLYNSEGVISINLIIEDE